MINPQYFLNSNIFKEDIERKHIRDGFSEGLLKIGRENKEIVVLSADLSVSTKADVFKKEFPDRFIEVGVAEQNLVTIASGMAAEGKIPFVTSYAVFSPGRNWEQIRTTICYNNQPVKIVGSHAGITVGPDGATHQALEDIALMRVLPNMVVVCPADTMEARKATEAMAKNGQPSYLRLSRNKAPQVTTDETPFEIGRCEIFQEGSDASIIACGEMVYYSLLAAKKLEEQNIYVRVINCHTIKPIDRKTILKAAEETGAFVTVEDHQIAGGLGSAVSEVISGEYPVPIKIVGINDTFGESGSPEELLEKYGLTEDTIIQGVIKVLRMKRY
jgi:transketolase